MYSLAKVVIEVIQIIVYVSESDSLTRKWFEISGWEVKWWASSSKWAYLHFPQSLPADGVIIPNCEVKTLARQITTSGLNQCTGDEIRRKGVENHFRLSFFFLSPGLSGKLVVIMKFRGKLTSLTVDNSCLCVIAFLISRTNGSNDYH